MEALKENEALEFLKSMQGAIEVNVPLVIKDKLVHPGITFNVALQDYNNFINDSASSKSTPTAAAKNLLMRCVSEQDKQLVGEALKVPGIIDEILLKVIERVKPNISTTLDLSQPA